MFLAVMDTHIRWKVKRRITDAHITLAVILLFVSSQTSSGKMQLPQIRGFQKFFFPLFFSVDQRDIRPSFLQKSSLCVLIMEKKKSSKFPKLCKKKKLQKVHQLAAADTHAWQIDLPPHC